MKIRICILFGIWCLVFGISPAVAQEDNTLVNLSKQIIETKTNQDLYAPFESLKDRYFKDNKYGEFVDFLKSLTQKKKSIGPFADYYVALSRYSQLKYLEEKQLWDEYFAQGNNYREELTSNAQKSIDSTMPQEPLNLYCRLLLWQFHGDQQDTFAESSLTDLMNAVAQYAKLASDLKPIKVVADKLFAYGEKAKSRELYKIYAERLVSSGIKDEQLASEALALYKAGNLELSENIYDAYLDRAVKSLPKDKSLPILMETARLFVYKDQGQSDAVYAEEIFKKIAELGSKDIFDEDLMYLRAYNLEKQKAYAEAKEIYNDLIIKFPQTAHADEAIYKQGIICAYALRDAEQAKVYFEQLAKKQPLGAQAAASLYQLGILSQWENDNEKAKTYFNKLIEQAGSASTLQDVVVLAKQRLQEITSAKPIEYNLKTFLDISLNPENKIYDMSKLDLRAHPYKTKPGSTITINSTAYTAPTGCMQVELQYLWSGNTGTNPPSANQSSFNASFEQPGTKEIFLVVVSPAGIIDRALDMVDID